MAPLPYSSLYCISQIAGSEAGPPDGGSAPSGVRGLHLFVVQCWAARLSSFIKPIHSSAVYPFHFLNHPPFFYHLLSSPVHPLFFPHCFIMHMHVCAAF